MFKHLHIVACSPRSGTTLLHEAMVACFDIDKFYDHEMRFNLVSAEDQQILLTKRPKDTMYVGAILDSVPDFYVIYLLRDPRDVIVSRHGKDSKKFYSNIRLWREMQAYAKPLRGYERFLEIRYEDFVTNPDETQDAIVAKFPWLYKRHRFSVYHEHAQVSAKSLTAMHSVRPIAPNSVGVWRGNLARIKGQQQIHGSLTPDLIECAYETSGEWQQPLQNIEPDLSSSRYPEKVYFWSRISQHINALRKIENYKRKRRSA